MKAFFVTLDGTLASSLKDLVADLSPDITLDMVRPEDATQLVATGAADAVLVDIRLPQNDAPDLLAAISRRRLPLVLIVTAARTIAAASPWALRANADDYVWSYDIATGESLSSQAIASQVSAALRHTVERHGGIRSVGEVQPPNVLRVVYLGDDEALRAVLNGTSDMRLVSIEEPAAHVAVIDASPYDAIQSLGKLRDASSSLPVIFLCRSDASDAGDAAAMLQVEHVLVKADDWLPALLQTLRSAARVGHVSMESSGPAAPPPELSPRRQETAGTTHFLPALRSESDPDEVAPNHPLSEWNAAHDLEEERARRHELQRLLDKALEREASLTSSLATERTAAAARLQVVEAEQQQTLRRERAEREKLVQWLKTAQDELKRRSQPVKPARLASGIARRNARLAELFVGVVAQLESLIAQVAEGMTPALDNVAKTAPPNVPLAHVRQTAERARDIARQFLEFTRWQAQPLAPVDLGSIISDLEPTLQRLLGRGSELVVEVEPGTADVALTPDQVERLLISLTVLCCEALPIGGQVRLDVRNVETVPFWDPAAPQDEPLAFVTVTAAIRGHAPSPLCSTPALDGLMQECEGYCDEVATDVPSTGLRLYLPPAAPSRQT
jgi:DNA-binding NarL/FixJ family response regulator